MTVQPLYAPPPRPSLARRLLGLGIGAVLALVYWGLVAACLVVTAVSFFLTVPALIVLTFVITACAWGCGLFLCVVAALLTISPQLRRGAVAFLLASAAANVALAVVVLLAFLAVTLFV
jgi:hypothetical protein